MAGLFFLGGDMVTMMEHAQHGRHPATGAEIAALKSLGWTECAPKNKAAPVSEPEEVTSNEAPKKRGRPAKVA